MRQLATVIAWQRILIASAAALACETPPPYPCAPALPPAIQGCRPYSTPPWRDYPQYNMLEHQSSVALPLRGSSN